MSNFCNDFIAPILKIISPLETHYVVGLRLWYERLRTRTSVKKTQVNVYQNVKFVHHYLNCERSALCEVILRRFSDLVLVHRTVRVRPTVSRESLRSLLGKPQAWRYCGQCSVRSVDTSKNHCNCMFEKVYGVEMCRCIENIAIYRRYRYIGVISAISQISVTFGNFIIPFLTV